MSLKDRILGSTPLFELIIRRIYYSDFSFLSRFSHSVFQSINKKKKQNSQRAPQKDEVFYYLESLGIREGDILIVHTSEYNLNRCGINPKELFFELRKLVGEDGTLVLPTYPLYNDSAFDKDKKAFVYNPQKPLCSTGMIPNLFLRMKNVKRSLIPVDTLSAQGPEAAKMMEHDLENDLPHGINTPWYYCYERNAKILLLGVKSSHTTSMVHAAEDIMDKEWPIDGWYKKQTYIIKNNNSERLYTIRARKQEWSKYNASWYRSEQLRRKGILKETKINGLNIAYMSDSKELVDYIIERNRKHKGFFVVPRRLYKDYKKK